MCDDGGNLLVVYDSGIYDLFCTVCRTSRRNVFWKMAVIKIYAKCSGKHLWWNPFLVKFQHMELQHRCFPVTFRICEVNLFREDLRRLLLNWWIDWKRMKRNIGTGESPCQNVGDILNEKKIRRFRFWESGI